MNYREPYNTLLKALLLSIIWFALFYMTARSQAVAIDGDSFYYENTEYRLACVDAPEYDQAGGSQAKRYLQFWLDRPFHLETVGEGVYGRKLVYLWSEGVLVNDRLFEAGIVQLYKNECYRIMNKKAYD